MFQLNCHHQGANTYIVKTYSIKHVLQCLRISNVHLLLLTICQYTDVPKHVGQLTGLHRKLQNLRFTHSFVYHTDL
jgi:hypothetical protein